MEINPASMSVGAAQMQARFEMAQSQRALSDVQAAANKAQAAAQNPADATKAAAIKKLEKVSRDFESIFLSYMLKTMRETVPKDGILGNSQENDIFTAMHDDELAKNLSQAGGIGLGKLMVEQLKKTI